MGETKPLALIGRARIGAYGRGGAATTATCVDHRPRGVELPINHLEFRPGAIELRPAPAPGVTAAVTGAARRSGADPEPAHPPYASPGRRPGLPAGPTQPGAV